MAKITIVGDAVVVTSALKLEDLKTIAKYRPEALVLKGGEDGKQEIFRLGVSCGNGSISGVGAVYGSATHDDEKKATMTILIGGPVCGDIKEIVADTIGANVQLLNKIEDTLPTVLNEIETEKARIMESIVVA